MTTKTHDTDPQLVDLEKGFKAAGSAANPEASAYNHAIRHRLTVASEFGTGDAEMNIRAADSSIAVEVAEKAIKALQAFKRAHTTLAKLDDGGDEE